MEGEERGENGTSDDLEPLIFADTESGRHNLKKSAYTKRSDKCIHKRGILVFLVLLVSVLAITSVYFRKEDDFLGYYKIPAEKFRSKPENIITFDELMEENFEFDIHGQDVMVFLHMQKTGGTTFGKHLVQDLDLERDCQCHKGRLPDGRKRKMRCDCFRPGKGKKNWLFSRYSVGWKCGLHSDWTELTGCVDTYLRGIEPGEKARRYFYITILREPIARYLSEFRHVQRGATWGAATYMCGGKAWGPLLTKCYHGEDWSSVNLDEFLACDHNMAANRQTRMLADLELVGCYNKSGFSPKDRDRILLKSAKSNLEKMAFFGLTEDQRISQYLFEETFNLEFVATFDQYNVTRSSKVYDELEPQVVEKIKSRNQLDLELYEFAKKLLEERFEKMKKVDTKFDAHMERLKTDKKLPFSWQTIEDENEDIEN
eukprot:TRINITY_DN8228_c1_g1_i1.p1 TRINITY_DN8228_c1_g1~~TRINITY_DN8228_c1_g1_i1.p1  ORF type:complete len:429 (+),score=85.47 TRINITY_DN8228_c1_g1_i1:62-1348(+)